MFRRTALVTAVVATVAVPSPAWAHGTLGPDRAVAGTPIETNLAVPSEREGRTNRRVALALPPGFVAVSCRAPAGWTCRTTARGFVWQWSSGSDAEDEFGLTMRVAGRPGTYLLPLAQTYDDGETRTFAEPPGRRGEGPVFTVSGAATTVADGTPAAAGDPDDPALSALPAGRQLEAGSSDGGSALLVGLGVVGGTALLGTVLLLRRRRPDDDA